MTDSEPTDTAAPASTPPEPLIEVSGLEAWYGRRRILRDLSPRDQERLADLLRVVVKQFEE